jgi:hypothetical protein
MRCEECVLFSLSSLLFLVELTFFLSSSPSSSSFHLPPSQAKTPDLTTTEPFSDTFGAKAQRKRPRLDFGSLSELAGSIDAARAKDAEIAKQAAIDQRLSEIRDAEGSLAPELVKAEEEEAKLGNVPQDWILAAGTSKRIWGELYKVRFLPVLRLLPSMLTSSSLTGH